MQIQVNSDRTVSVDASLKKFVKGEVERVLDTVAAKVTRVEIHLSDVNAGKTGPEDKRCVVEARPAGGRPLSTSATARKLDAAIGQALRKMLRALRSFFGRQSRVVPGRSAPTSRVQKAAVAAKAATRTKTKPETRPQTSTAAKRARRAE